MIYDKLQHVSLYQGIHPRLAAALRYVASLAPDITDGVYPLEASDLVARVQTYETLPEAEQRWESHRAYVDVQVVLTGEEHIVYAPTGSLVASTGYDEEKDLIRYEAGGEETLALTLRPGDFAVFFPHDGHKPGISIASPTTVHKVVVKVAVW